jgi:hypothetical protein
MQAPGDETSKGGDCWRGKIRCVPSRDETDSCLVAGDDRAMMRTHAAHASNARSKLRSKTSWGFRAERAQQSIDQSINQSINQAQIAFPRPCSAILQAPCHGCHAHDATPTSLPRRTTHGDMGDSGPHTILHTGIIISCIGGNKGLDWTTPCKPRSDTLQIYLERKNSGFNFPSPRSQENYIYALQQTDLASYIGGGWR